jgi:hypothetical protein
MPESARNVRSPLRPVGLFLAGSSPAALQRAARPADLLATRGGGGAVAFQAGSGGGRLASELLPGGGSGVPGALEQGFFPVRCAVEAVLERCGERHAMLEAEYAPLIAADLAAAIDASPALEPALAACSKLARGR